MQRLKSMRNVFLNKGDSILADMVILSSSKKRKKLLYLNFYVGWIN